MAKFRVSAHAGKYVDAQGYSPETTFTATDAAGSVLTADDLLECLRPAAIALVKHYKEAITRYFKKRSGQLVDSVDFDDSASGGKYAPEERAFIRVGLMGRRKGSTTFRKSKAGPAGQRYSKHNRSVNKALKNEELGYFLEYGTPRIKATHWMENTNEAVAEEIQDIIENQYTELLKKKGLID